MKKSRIIFTIIMFITCLLTTLFNNKVQATPLTSVRYYGIAELRESTKMGYAMGDPDAGAERIWKIVRYSDTSYTDPTEVNVYCIKADQGFSNQSRTETYDVSYNMKTEKDAISAQNDVLKELVNGGQYDNLLALADILYVKDVSTVADREQLLNASGANDIVKNSDFNGIEEYYITDDEIEAVQQAAIWYFSNYQQGGEYDKYGKNSWIWYTSSTDSGEYKNFSSYNPTNIAYASATAGYFRQQQMTKLYDYLIETAKSNAINGVNDKRTILTVYASNQNAEAQPIMQVEKLPKEFDLSVRNYITEINDESLANSRIPNIDESTLETGTTATYKHRKDPVEVKLNDTITYNITIYNEGEKAGRATEIVYQLPTGLEFVEVVSGNFEKSSYSTEDNTLYLTRKSNNTTNLSAYTEGNLSSETIQIKCKVTETGGESDKILTNIVWLAEEIDEDGNVITNEPGDDRDSEPSTITTQTKDQLVTTDNGYIGNSSNNGKDLTNSQNYFEGQQDDDDFEKVVVRAVTRIDVSKKWDDSGNQDGKRVGTVTVELLRNETTTGQTVTLTENNNWSGKFENLPTKINGEDVTYSVKETTSISGYVTVVSSVDNTNGKSFTITNSYTPETTQITATKVWEDNNNQDAKRPTSVEFELYKNETATGTKKTLTGNNWTATFDNLPVYENGNKITYTVKEVSVPTGYISSGDGTEANQYTITNIYTPETTQVTVTKQWVDKNNQDNKRPTTLKIELYRKVGSGAEEFVREATMTGTGNTWAGRFTDLPVYENGEKITYIVKEINENGNLDEYTSSGDATEENNYTFINTHKIFDLSLRKYIVAVSTDETIEESDYLMNTGNSSYQREPSIDTGNLDNGTGTTATYNHRKDPVVVETGNIVVYNITIYNEGEKEVRATKITDQLPRGLEFVEVLTEGFTGSVDANNKLTITRNSDNTTNLSGYEGSGTLASETIQITCKVTAEAGSENSTLTNVAWISEAYDAEEDKLITIEEKVDTDSELGTIPTIDGQEVTQDDLVTTDDGYIGNENNQGKDLSNSEEYFEGQQDSDDFEKIILTSITQVQVNKVWNDNNNQDGLRPENIQVQLLKNGQETGNTVTLNNGNNWTETFDNLPVKENGEKITYTVNEIKVDGYSVNITQNAENNFTITNTHTPIVTSVSVNKVWDDKDNKDGLRSESVVIELLKNGESLNPQRTVTLSEENQWTDTFDNLPIKENGVEVEYTVRELTQIEGYETTIVDNSTGKEINNELASVNEEKTIETYATKSMVRATSENVEPKNFTITNTHIVEEFDLALIKFISAVDGTQYDRAPNVDLSGLEQGTTAIYKHSKEPVLVKRNSLIIYTIRVYNEGEIDGYAKKVTDYLPKELEFLPEHEINIQYEWQVSEDGRIVSTDYLSSAKETEERQNEIKAFDGQTLDYKELQIACKVKEEAGTNIKLINLAEITEDENENGIPDRDSITDNIEIPDDEELPGYKDDEIDQDYASGQEDDDYFERAIIQNFDLALRKFITKVDEEEVTTRIPEISYNREENQITYNHTKEPVEIIIGNVVEYTIRVYNEGDIAGYAKEVADDIPDGLKYLPQNETNIEYRWVMYDEEGNETENVEEAVEIRTHYLSKEQEATEGENLLQAFNPEEEIGEGNPDYRDIKVAFEVVEPNESDRIIVNSAQITENSDENGNPVEDIDSVPGEWNEGEDNQDREYIKLAYFDLALKKWVTEAIVIENGQQTVTQTGHTAETNPEPVVKVEVYRKNLNDVVVKFKYSIRIINQGDIAGYATEITDYVPEGLRFVAEDNSGWTDEGNNVISTRLLENTLLQPGETADVEVVLTWINGENNMGQMTNIAEISEDYNDKGAPDRYSTPDNRVWGEDDMDDAPVLLSIETGQEKIYYVLGFTVLGTLAGALVFIKKFVI